MTRAGRPAGEELTLKALEEDFRRALIDALNRCSGGVWGVFGHNDAVHASLPRSLRERLASQDARILIEIGDEIEERRTMLGLPQYNLYQRFLKYRVSRDANSLGEPALARQFLVEIGFQ